MKKMLSWKKTAAIGLTAAMALGTIGYTAMAGITGRQTSADSRTQLEASVKTDNGKKPTVEAESTGQKSSDSDGQEKKATDADRDNQQTAEDSEAEKKEREVAESEVDAFYQNSVLVGDSVMMGYRNYCMRSDEPFLKSLNFLASGSFSVHNSLWPVSKKSVHPIYQGAQRPVWESISMMKAEKVFLFFGLNDLNMGDDTCELYQQLVANIKQLSPEAQIHVISMTYTLKGKGKGKLNNDNIRVFNSQLCQLAEEQGWGFIDMATALADENGDLAAAYCSDNYVHQSRAAYEVWTSVLRQYAKDQLKYTPEPQV